jgi:alpha-L-rhamnosidase
MLRVKHTELGLILLFFLAFRANGQSLPQVPKEKINPGLLTDHWHAEWITHPGESVLDYGVFHFRKSFELNTLPVEFIIHVSADNRYRLFINGTCVCFGPARGDLPHWFYESIDIAPYLKKGKNTVATVVWNYGEFKPWAQFSLKTAFILQGNSPPEELINTNSSWKVLKDIAYSSAGAGSKETDGQFVVVGPCDRVDAALYPWGWETPGFDDHAWLTPRSLDVGHPYGVGTDINWVLTPRRIPMMEQYRQRFLTIRRLSGVQNPEEFLAGKKTWTIPSNNRTVALIDQGTLTTAYPELLVSGGKGSKIKVTYAESLFDSKGQKGNRNAIIDKSILGYSDYFLPDGGNARLFRPLWFRTWRYVQLEIETGNEPLVLEDFSSEFSAYPLKEKSVFESDRADLKQIWNVGWRTARLCANETYFDCPYYEQLQYVGDTRIQALISMYVSGDDRLVRSALLSFDESRTHEGLTQSRYPSSATQFIPPYSLFWIDMVHDYWMLRDDPEFVKGFLPGIENVIKWYTRRIDPATGLLGKTPYWNFVDWAREWPWLTQNRIGGVPAGGEEGNSSVLTLQLAYAVKRAGELFQYFGDSAKSEIFSQMAKQLTRSVYSACWDEKRGYLADTPEKTVFSMHAQIFAILTHTIPENQQKAFTERFLADKSLIQPTMYFRFYLTHALFETGLADHYLETLGLWTEMLEKGLTTFAENPDPSRSDCHAWSACPNYDLLATVAGIRPDSPGFKTIHFEPSLGPLSFIKGSMPHMAGNIRFELKRTGQTGISGFIELPPGLTGTFHWNGKSVELHDYAKIEL